MTRRPCEHPISERWQYPLHWLCCKCCRYFWGDKREMPATDIYGMPAFPDNATPCVKRG